MELFSSSRWRLYRSKLKAVVFMTKPKKLCSKCRALFHTCLLLGRSGCSFSSTKELIELKLYLNENSSKIVFKKVKFFIQKCSSKVSANFFFFSSLLIINFFPWPVKSLNRGRLKIAFWEIFASSFSFVLFVCKEMSVGRFMLLTKESKQYCVSL